MKPMSDDILSQENSTHFSEHPLSDSNRSISNVDTFELLGRSNIKDGIDEAV